VKLAAVERYLDEGRAAEIVAGHYGEPVAWARMQVKRAEWNAAQAGL
jgi:hypothetical protein